jgi:hypothetical protein
LITLNVSVFVSITIIIRQRIVFRLYMKSLRTSQFYSLWRSGPTRAKVSSFLMFLDHTQRRTTVGRTALGE